MVEQLIDSLSKESGFLQCRHGDRLSVARGLCAGWGTGIRVRTVEC